jgi:MFS family permease
VLRNVALLLRPAGWPLLPDAARRRTRLLAWAAILAQAVFVGGWVLGGALEPHYSQVRQYISELGRRGAVNPWIFTIFVGIWGLGFIALAVALVPSLRTRLWPLAMPLFFVLAGLCAILVGQLQMDCAPTVSAVCRSREAADALSWHHYAHEWVSLGIKVSLLLTGFTFARSAWPSRLARLVLTGALVLLAAGIVTFVLHDSFAGYQGLEERLWALVAQLWVLLCATVLILEATLEPRSLQIHEAAMQRHALGERTAVGAGPSTEGAL